MLESAAPDYRAEGEVAKCISPPSSELNTELGESLLENEPAKEPPTSLHQADLLEYAVQSACLTVKR